jgi:hypothetical protein
MNYFFVLLLALISPTISANLITFGDSNSAIKVGAGATLLIDKTLTNIGGNIVKDSGAIIKGKDLNSRIIFENGYYTDDGRSMLLNAEIDPSKNPYNGHSIALGGGKTFAASSGVKIGELTITGTGNILTGRPDFNGDISLTNSAAKLRLNIDGKLNANIVLNGGEIILDDDLKFSDGYQFFGEGNIILNGNGISFGGESLLMESTLNFDGGTDVSLNSRTQLSSVWSFSLDSLLEGHGHTLEFLSGGALLQKGDKTLDIASVNMRGVGVATADQFRFEIKAGQMRMTNVNMEFVADYTQSNGGFYVEGPTRFTLKDKIFTLDTNASMTIDGVTLVTDKMELGGAGQIVPSVADNFYLSTINNGRIMEIDSPVGLDWLDHGPSNIHLSSNTTMSYDFKISPDHKLNLKGNMTFDGASHKIECSRENIALITLDAGVTVTMQDVLIEGLKSSHLSLGAGAHLSFGNGTRVALAQNDDLAVTWTFEGSSSLYGAGTALTLVSGGEIYVGSSGNCTVQNLNVLGVQGDRIRCQSDSESFIFHDSSLVLSGNYTLDQGLFVVDGKFDLKGPYQFAYQSSMGSTINSNSELFVGRDVTFKYNPSASFKNLIVMNDATSKFHLDGCTLDISSTGLQLTNGTVVISNQNYVQSAATHNEEALIFGDANGSNDVTLEIEAGGDLQLLSGIMLYRNALG